MKPSVKYPNMAKVFMDHIGGNKWAPSNTGWLSFHGDWVGFRSVGKTRFDIEVSDGIFYILWIEIDIGMKGKGHGARLYKHFESIARELNCHQIRQTPSGWTITGETRRSYLKRRGWIEDTEGREVYKDLA